MFAFALAKTILATSVKALDKPLVIIVAKPPSSSQIVLILSEGEAPRATKGGDNPVASTGLTCVDEASTFPVLSDPPDPRPSRLMTRLRSAWRFSPDLRSASVALGEIL